MVNRSVTGASVLSLLLAVTYLAGGVEMTGSDARFRIFVTSISANGRFVVFNASGPDVELNEHNEGGGVFVRDRLSETTECVSVSEAGEQIADATTGHVSDDGRYVAFVSRSGGVVPEDGNGQHDVFLRDRVARTTVRVSVAVDGTDSDGASSLMGISGNGRFVLFDSVATNLVPKDTNGKTDTFLRDMKAGTTDLISVSLDGEHPARRGGYAQDMSRDARYVIFDSGGEDVVKTTQNGVCLRDRMAGATELVSLGSDGAPAVMCVGQAFVSDNGRLVAFQSMSTKLAREPPVAWADSVPVYVRDRRMSLTSKATVDNSGLPPKDADEGSYFVRGVSGDGRFVLFESYLGNLVAGDTNQEWDLFVRDRVGGKTIRVSVSSDGTEGNAESRLAVISKDGRYIAFSSKATNLVEGDTNGQEDVFVHDLKTGETELVSVPAVTQ